MAIDSGFEREEIRREQENRAARELEWRTVMRKEVVKHLVGFTRQTVRLVILLLMSMTLIYVLSANNEINNYFSQMKRKLSARPSAQSVIRQGALNYEAEVDAASH